MRVANWERRPFAVVLASRLRACWHILRGRRVVYHVNISGGVWEDSGWQRDLVFVDCRHLAGFQFNGIPAVELEDRFGDLRVRSRQIEGFNPLP